MAPPPFPTTVEFWDRCRMSMKARAIPVMIMPEERPAQCRAEAAAASAGAQPPSPLSSTKDAAPQRAPAPPTPSARKEKPGNHSTASVTAAATLLQLVAEPKYIGGRGGREKKEQERGAATGATGTAELASMPVTAGVASAQRGPRPSVHSPQAPPAQQIMARGKGDEERIPPPPSPSESYASAGFSVGGGDSTPPFSTVSVTRTPAPALPTPLHLPAPPAPCFVCKEPDGEYCNYKNSFNITGLRARSTPLSLSLSRLQPSRYPFCALLRVFGPFTPAFQCPAPTF